MRHLLRRFRGCEEANVAVIFALSLLPLLLAVGSAVDYSRAANLHSQLQADTDAAALAACKSPLTSATDLKALAQQVLNGFMPGKITIDDRTFIATNNPRSIEITTSTSYTPQFIKLPRPMTVSTTSVCAAGENFYEIALVLDTTGSMNNSAGSKTKIEALRESAAAFVNTMFANFDADHVKISIVPFAASVKVDPTSYASATWLDTAGQSSIHWQNVLDASTNGFTSRLGIFNKLKASESSWGWAGCLESLPYPYNTKDETPSSGTPDTLYVPLFAPDEYGNSSDASYNNNSYVDDGTSSYSGSCRKDLDSKTTRMGQACKYKTPTDVRNSRPGPNWGCTSRAITRLTNSQTALTTEISKLTANGQTNIHEGLHWGWRTISKTGVFNDAEAYDTKNVTKVIVLMTDGMNTWTGDRDIYVAKSQYSAYGYFNNADGTKTEKRLPTGYGDLNDTDDSKSSAKARKAIDQLTRETCANARAKGVAIYTVGFSVSGDSMDEAGLQLLKDCSADASRSFLATDVTSLNKSFEDIAKGIGEMRITR
jgi:Flp pilus assembly protein TadG